MAVKRLADAYPHHRQQALGVFTGFVVALSAFIAFLLITIGISAEMTLLVTGTIGLVCALGGVLLLNFALEPLDFLSRVITHASNQPNNVMLPNLNGTRHEKTGYKQMITTLYDLALEQSKTDNPHKSSTQRLELLDRLPCGVIALDSDRNVLYANHAAPIVAADKTSHLQLVFEGDNTLDNWLAHVEASQVGASKLWSRVQNALPGKPERRLFDVFASYQKNGKDDIETIIVTVDRTDDYSRDEENMDFIALAAHELRGPVTVIHGYLDILRRELELSTQQTALFDRLEVSASRLSGYISNILNASKYDRRHLKLHLHEDRLASVYQTVADDLSLRAKTQNRLLQVQIPTDLPTIAADRTSLSEVMANFVDNAIKYSNEGGCVSITAKTEGDFVCFSVTDQGIGMPASVVSNLFTKFYRSHRSRASVAGTGLGLYISKVIVESHGGSVSVKSQEGEGSTFSCLIPIYSTVKDKLLANGHENKGFVKTGSGWIKNHAAYRG